MKANLYIIEEQEIYHKLYEIALFSTYNLEILIEVPNAPIVKKVYEEHRPDVLMISIRSINSELVDTINQIRNENKKLGIILFLSIKNRQDIELLRKIAGVKSGGLGLFQKQSIESLEQLVNIVNTVYRGQVIMDSYLSSSLLSFTNQCPLLREITQREQEILALVAEGYTNEAIAKKLFIDVKTVEHHLNNLYSKLKSITNFTERHPRVHAARLYMEAMNSLTDTSIFEDQLIQAK